MDIKSGVFKPCESTPEKIPHFALYVKDKFNLSDTAYREITQLSSSLPSLYKIKELSNQINSSFEILSAPSGISGVQQSFQQRLSYRLQNVELYPGEVIKVKLTGDGTYIAKHIHVFNFAFTLLNESKTCQSVFW